MTARNWTDRRQKGQDRKAAIAMQLLAQLDALAQAARAFVDGHPPAAGEERLREAVAVVDDLNTRLESIEDEILPPPLPDGLVYLAAPGDDIHVGVGLRPACGTAVQARAVARQRIRPNWPLCSKCARLYHIEDPG